MYIKLQAAHYLIWTHLDRDKAAAPLCAALQWRSGRRGHRAPRGSRLDDTPEACQRRVSAAPARFATALPLPRRLAQDLPSWAAAFAAPPTALMTCSHSRSMNSAAVCARSARHRIGHDG